MYCLLILTQTQQCLKVDDDIGYKCIELFNLKWFIICERELCSVSDMCEKVLWKWKSILKWKVFFSEVNESYVCFEHKSDF